MEATVSESKYGKIIICKECSLSGVSVKYTLFESLFQIDGQHIYSVQLETSSEYGRDCTAACDISRNRSEAMNLFRKLADAVVTSCTLYEVLEDLL